MVDRTVRTLSGTGQMINKWSKGSQDTVRERAVRTLSGTDHDGRQQPASNSLKEKSSSTV